MPEPKSPKTSHFDQIDTLKTLGEPLPETAIQRTKAFETHKSYDTDGYGYQACVDRFNEVLGASWGFRWEILKEVTGKYSSGKPYYDITVLMRIWINTPDNTRSCAGGHISLLYADALKGAITNSFKKTAAFWGVGRQAYLGMLDDDNKPLPEEEDKGMRSNNKSQPAAQNKPQGNQQGGKKPAEPADLALLEKIGALCMFMAEGDKEKADEYYHDFADFDGKDGGRVKAPALKKLPAKWAGNVYGKLKKEYEKLGLDAVAAYYEYGLNAEEPGDDDNVPF